MGKKEGLFLPVGEWRGRSAPYRIANHVAKHSRRRFEQGRMPDGSGWVFKSVARGSRKMRGEK